MSHPVTRIFFKLLMIDSVGDLIIWSSKLLLKFDDLQSQVGGNYK